MMKEQINRREKSLDCTGLDKGSFLKAFGEMMQFGPHFGENFDALYDSLADDLDERGPLQVDLLNWSASRMNRASRETLIGIFEDLQQEFEPGMLRVRIIDRIIG